MSEPSDKKHEQDAGVDIFGSGAAGTPTPPAAATNTAATNTVGQSNRVPKLGIVHFGGAGALLAAMWIGWPYMFGQVPDSSASDRYPRMLVPTQDPKAVAAAEFARQQVPKEAGSAPGHAVPIASAPVSAPAEVPAVSAPSADAVPQVPDASAITVRPVEQRELLSPTGRLMVRLHEAEARARACTPAAGAVQDSKLRKVARKVQPVPRTGSGGTKSSRMTVFRNFTLNTIYQGQAWIQSAERTYVVQVGDVVDGATIERIDPRARQVVTSLGVIR